MANSLLDRYKQIQSNPIGSNTALSPTTAEQGNPYGQMSAAGNQYRRLEESYGRVLRILNHAARRGNANAALQSIAVRKDAMGQGFAPGGIRNAKASAANIYQREASGERATADQDLANQVYRKRAGEELAGGENWWDRRNRTPVGPTDTPESYSEDQPYDTAQTPNYDTDPTGTGQTPGVNPAGWEGPPGARPSVEPSTLTSTSKDLRDKWGRKRALGSFGLSALYPA